MWNKLTRVSVRVNESVQTGICILDLLCFGMFGSVRPKSGTRQTPAYTLRDLCLANSREFLQMISKPL